MAGRGRSATPQGNNEDERTLLQDAGGRGPGAVDACAGVQPGAQGDGPGGAVPAAEQEAKSAAPRGGESGAADAAADQFQGGAATGPGQRRDAEYGRAGAMQADGGENPDESGRQARGQPAGTARASG